jgi:hypothetical protein
METKMAKPMPAWAFRRLPPDDEAAFRKWARENYTPGDEVRGIWHPIVREECERMNAERTREVGACR